MGNCCCPPDNLSVDTGTEERQRLLSEPQRPNYSISTDNNVITNEQTDNDDQAALSRIVQEAQESLIDVSAFDQHALEHHEYVDRSRMYATRINNEFERQIRDAIQKTVRSRTLAGPNGSAMQRLAELQVETQHDDAAMMQQLTADFEQRLASSGIRLIGDLVVRVTGERVVQPAFLGQAGSAFVPTQNLAVVPVSSNVNVPPVGLLPATTTNNVANA